MLIDFDKILIKQQELDDKFAKNYPKDIIEDEIMRSNTKVIALQCELHELGNELMFNKHWKLTKTYDRDAIMNEVGDVLCFLFSCIIENYLLKEDVNEEKLDDLKLYFEMTERSILNFWLELQDDDKVLSNCFIKYISEPTRYIAHAYAIVSAVHCIFEIDLDECYALAYKKNLDRIESKY